MQKKWLAGFPDRESQKKLGKIMKLIILFFFGFMMTVSANSYSQKTKLDVNLSNTTIKGLFEYIERNSEFVFLYRSEDFNTAKKVDIELKEATVYQILDQALKGENVAYDVYERQVVIRKAGEPANVPQQQKREISGTVKDANGISLPGVSVVVKGTTIGSITDMDGQFKLSVPADATTLVFSFIGMKSQTISIAGKVSISLTMEEETIGLEEVVAIGYGTTKKMDLTGSVSSLSAKDIAKQPSTRVLESMQGRVPGVDITRVSGTPGSGIKIRIRGANSINANNDPLYVVDGYVGGDISDINPSDIESLNILKDASATAVYGSRGANGVVIVTTKRAKAGSTKITMETFYSRTSAPRKFDLMNAAEYADQVNVKSLATGGIAIFSSADLDSFVKNGGTDWQDEIFQTGGIQNYQLSLSSGTEKLKYYLSGNFANEIGILQNTGYKRYSIRSNINSKINDRVNLDFNLSYTIQKKNNLVNNTVGQTNSIISNALAQSPTLPVYDITGEYSQPSGAYGTISVNPKFLVLENNSVNNVNNLVSTLSLKIDLLKGLKFTSNATVQIGSANINGFSRYNPGSLLSTSSSTISNAFTTILQSSNILDYSKEFGVHKISGTGIFETMSSQQRVNNISAGNFTSIALGYNGIALAGTKNAGSGFSDFHLNSYVGRFNYTLLERYLLTGTARIDGSSKFAPNNQYSIFPSAAFAWRISKESFLKDVKAISDLKLRMSWGITGNQAIAPYATLAKMQTGADYPWDGKILTPGVGVADFPNQDLKWESTKQTNIGFDLTLFNGRLDISADVYDKYTRDLLVQISIPQYTGKESYLTNMGKMQNRGLELKLNSFLINTGDLRWETSLSFSTNKNTVLEVNDPAKDNEYIFGVTPGGTGIGIGPGFILQEGKQMGQFWGLIYDGVWKTSEATEAALYGNKPGDAKYKDMDGNKKYDDFAVIGHALPDFTGGFYNKFSWKNLSLEFLFQGSHGNDVWNFTRYFMIAGGSNVKNPTSKDIFNRWSPGNEYSSIPAYSNTSVTQIQSSMFVEDGSFLRLKNLSLGYNLPEAFCKKMKLQSVYIYANGQNLLSFTKYSGYDPEVSSTSVSDDTNFGIDNGAYPNPKVYTIGIKMDF
jgi:TonB-linked SusC/RagA family outer membrane protein